MALLCWVTMISWHTTAQQKTLRDTHTQGLTDSLTVWVFLAVDCPISQKYISELRRMDSVYTAHKLRVRGIVPGKINPNEVKTFVDEYAIKFPVSIDRDFTDVRRFHATITPEAILVDRQGQILYQGAIDNWFFDLGKYRQRVTEHYLQDAIDAALQGKTPTVRKTEAVGCIIQTP
ncbi:redoxin domain-containing protein [Fulvivirgaceae bacterium PWU5]|uniref:Redoxin domain-containing protein n=1 Tax=Dawidia cretensis TaxID=2782350 RepID=A0AAP2E3P0_9BACT|nr:redoxin domain-containing protein [Dawidia cretensis]MBT1710932.1 redoxin domain-containing protein [Dawidia cretensis]